MQLRQWIYMLFALLCLGMATQANAVIDTLNFQSPQQEDSYHHLTQSLRCPQCQNNSIADSNAIVAQDMRKKVFTMLQEGKTDQQIVDYMVARYGNFVTYDPPMELSTIILWLIPALLVLFAGLWLWRPKGLFERNRAVMEEDLQNTPKADFPETFSPAEEARLAELLGEENKNNDKK